MDDLVIFCADQLEEISFCTDVSIISFVSLNAQCFDSQNMSNLREKKI